jgi:ABC-type multidrug transport system ATPase subunit
MDEAARCTDIGIVQGGQLIAKGSPLTLKESMCSKILEVQVKEVIDGMQIIRGLSGVYALSCAAVAADPCTRFGSVAR